MSIFTVKCCKTFFSKLDLTRILGIPTYDALHQMMLKLKSNALSIHSNIGGGTHVNLGLLTTNMKYGTLSPVLYVYTAHPVILQTPNNATRVSLCELKRVYSNNLQVFHKASGVEQALIQKIVTAVNKKYIISMKNSTTGKFTGDIRQIVVYLF